MHKRCTTRSRSKQEIKNSNTTKNNKQTFAQSTAQNYFAPTPDQNHHFSTKVIQNNKKQCKTHTLKSSFYFSNIKSSIVFTISTVGHSFIFGILMAEHPLFTPLDTGEM